MSAEMSAAEVQLRAALSGTHSALCTAVHGAAVHGECGTRCVHYVSDAVVRMESAWSLPASAMASAGSSWTLLCCHSELPFPHALYCVSV
jgi:hypothetical protein